MFLFGIFSKPCASTEFNLRRTFTKGDSIRFKDEDTLPVYLSQYWAICLMSRVFVNGLCDRGSIPGRVIRKTQK